MTATLAPPEPDTTLDYPDTLLIGDHPDTEALDDVRLPSFSGHPICTDLVSVGEDVHCESTAQEVHAGVPA